MSRVEEFLWFGHFPSSGPTPEPLMGAFTGIQSCEEAVPAHPSAGVLLRTFQQAIEPVLATADRPVVIPISGGYDSRLILGATCDILDSSEIVTYTFGNRQSLDFGLGRAVAKAAGVENIPIELDSVVHSLERLLVLAELTSHRSTLFDVPPFDLIKDCLGLGGTHLSGFMGDPLSGKMASSVRAASWENAVEVFAQTKALANERESILVPSFAPSSVLPESPVTWLDSFPYEEQLNFSIRQASYVFPHVAPTWLDVRFPFLEPRWLDLMSKNRDPSSLNRLRWNYLEMLKAGYPRLASVGSKDLDGLALNASPLRVRIHGGWKRELRQRSATFAAASRRKRLNYFDWDKVYASSPEFALSCNEFLIEGYEDILDEAPGLGTLSSFSGAQRHRLISWLILRQGG